MMKYKILMPALLCLITSGCLFMSEPFKPINYYDLGKTPEPAGLETPARIAGVKMSGPYKSSMVFRLKPNELTMNDYNKWAQTPETLVKSYLTAFMGQSLRSEGDATLLNANILAFEADLLTDKPEAVLTVEWTVAPPQGAGKSMSGGIKSYRTEMKDKTPACFAEAMTISVAKFAEELLANIRTANKK